MIVIKKDHSYFYQVMGQLRVTGRNCCYFVIHTTQWTNIEKIYYESEFWNTKMVDKLKMYAKFINFTIIIYYLFTYLFLCVQFFTDFT